MLYMRDTTTENYRGFKDSDLYFHIYVYVVIATGIPFLSSCCYSCVWCGRKCYKRQRVICRRQQPREEAQEDTDGQSEDAALLADRIVNPSYYHSMAQ